MRIFATHSITATSMWKLKFFWRQNQIFPSTCAVRSHHVLKIWMQVEKENMAQSFINLLEVSFVCCVSWTVLLTNSSLKHNFPAEGQLWTTMEAVAYLGKITSIANLGRQVIKWLLWYANMTNAAWNDLYVCSVYWRMKTRAMKQTLLAKNPAHEK